MESGKVDVLNIAVGGKVVKMLCPSYQDLRDPLNFLEASLSECLFLFGCTCTPPSVQRNTALRQPRDRHTNQHHLWPSAHILHTPYSHLSSDANNNYYYFEDSTREEDTFAAPANQDT